MTLGLEDIPKDAHFMPHEDPAMIEMLLEKVTKGRQSDLISTLMEALRRDPLLFKETGLFDFVTAFLNLSSQDRRRFAQYPPFYVWFNRCIRALSSNGKEYDLRQTLYKNRDIMAGFCDVYTNPKVSKIYGTQVLVQRFDIDPLIKELTPPAYQFPDEQRQQELQKIFSPVSFFAEVVGIAMERIRNTWPAAYNHIQKFVKIVCYVPDAPFRSSSATKYAGVIFMTSSYRSIIDLEDALVHECGHQVLYDINEVFPLINWKVKKMFELPWSGAERDWYGLINAFYIYVNLAHYYDRLKDRNEAELLWGHKRKMHIINGLVKAIPLIEENADDFTPSGMEFFTVLKQNVNELRDKM